MYVVAQIFGAIAGAALVLMVASGVGGGYDLAAGGLGANGYGLHSPATIFNRLAAFIAEVILTMFLVVTVLGCHRRESPGRVRRPGDRLVSTLIHLVGIPITNTSVNPARSIGPALFVQRLGAEQLWLFIVAPLVGGLLGAGVHRWLFRDGRAIAPGQSAVRAERLGAAAGPASATFRRAPGVCVQARVSPWCRGVSRAGAYPPAGGEDPLSACDRWPDSGTRRIRNDRAARRPGVLGTATTRKT